MDDLEAAWAELHAATPPGWFVGRPRQRYGGQWEQYTFDQSEKAHNRPTLAGVDNCGRD
jgi:hypothetical protein